MNHYAARQRESDKRWDYTCRNNSRFWAVGYCAGWREPQPDVLPKDQIRQWIDEMTPHRGKFHTDGHETPEEACDCYRRYMLDFSMRLDGEWSDAQHKFKVCGAWTNGYAQVASSTWTLCDEHRTREQVETLYGPMGEIWSS
jgi:hypothetical protein